MHESLVKSFENAISDMTEYKWAVTREELFSRLASKEEIGKLDLSTKEQIARLEKNTIELIAKLEKNTKEWIKASEIIIEEKLSKLATKDEISKLATKEELSKFATKDELDKFATKDDLNNLRTELIGKIEALGLKLDRKFTIMFIILFFTIIFVNQNSITLH